jgi:DNA-binding NarL/FixJ family response regulator
MDYDNALAAGRVALAEGRWLDARACFERVVAETPTPEAIELLAESMRWSHDVAALDREEEAYKLYRKIGDKRGAARMAMALSSDSFEFRGEPAVAQGWLQRARRLLEDDTDCAEFGWLRLWEGHSALMISNDAEFSVAAACDASAIGRRLELPDLEATALGLEGLALVTGGDVDLGIKRLDEGGAAVVSGEVSDINALATTICYMMDACDRIRDYDRASQWCARAVSMVGAKMPEALAVCRPHYAVVLMWRGDWAEAEEQLLLSNREIMEFRPPMVVEGLVRLAELRWRQGRWDEAETLFEQVMEAELSQLGRAELALSKGETTAALDLVQKYLRRIPPHDRIERAFGLDVMVRALLVADRTDEAEAYAAELRTIADRVKTEPMRAAACAAEGMIAAAKGDHEQARGCLEDAVDLLTRHGAPFETARVRLALAATLHALGRSESAAREATDALETFERMGAAAEARHALQLLSEIDPESAKELAVRDAAGLTRREMEVLRLIAAGRSNQGIADQLVLSVRTVERHISTIYDKIGVTGKAARAAVTAYAHKHGIT